MGRALIHVGYFILQKNQAILSEKTTIRWNHYLSHALFTSVH